MSVFAFILLPACASALSGSVRPLPRAHGRWHTRTMSTSPPSTRVCLLTGEEHRRRISSPRMLLPQLLKLDAKVLAAAAGGSLAGGLHAVSGPDHLSALLPLCIGRRWWIAVRIGALWGLGHGIGAALVGALAFAVRGALNINALSGYMEAVVGLSVMIIGANGVREAREWWSSDGGVEGEELHANSTRTSGLPDSPSQLAEARWAGRLSTLFTGILHGMTGSGNLLGVLPALTMPGWLGASMYLTCFGLGTLAAMSVFTALIGEVSCQFSARFDDPSTPAKLAMVSSIFALCVGVAWTSRAMMDFQLPLAQLWAHVWGLGRTVGNA